MELLPVQNGGGKILPVLEQLQRIVAVYSIHTT
jgi:hypothetical protein